MATYIRNILKEYREEIMIILLVNIFAFWLLTIVTTHIYKYPPDALYYAKQLPIFYWVGITLLCLAFALILRKPISNFKMHHIFQISFIILLVLYLFGTTSFIYSETRYMDVYTANNIVNNLVESGYTSNNSKMYEGNFYYSIIFFAEVSEISGESTVWFAKYYVIYLMLMISIFLYILSMKVLGEYSLITPTAYLSLAWTQDFHLSPQSYALILTLLFLTLIIESLIRKQLNGNMVKKRVIAIFVLITIVVSHAATSIINIIPLTFLLFIFFFFRHGNIFEKRLNLSKEIFEKKDVIYMLVLLFIIIYVAYLTYISDWVFSRVISTSQVIIDNLLQGETIALTDRYISVETNPSESYLLGYYIRMATIISMGILGILSSAYLILRYKNKLTSVVVCGLFGGYLSFPLFLSIGGYSMYGIGRGYIFSLIPFSILVAMVLSTKFEFKNRISGPGLLQYTLSFFIIISIILLPITLYSSDPYEFVAESDMSGREFLAQHPESGEIINFKNREYNFVVLKLGEGEDYLNEFKSNNLTKIYDSGQSGIYKADHIEDTRPYAVRSIKKTMQKE